MDQDELMVNGRGRVALWSRGKYPKIGGEDIIRMKVSGPLELHDGLETCPVMML